MPLYVYRCPAGHEQDRFTAVDDRDAPVVCPECRQPATRRIGLYAGFKFGRDGFLISPSATRRTPHAV